MTHIPDGLAAGLELGQQLGVVLLPLQRHALEQRRDLVQIPLRPRMSSQARLLLDGPLLRLQLGQIERERRFRGFLAHQRTRIAERTHRRPEPSTCLRSDPIVVLVAAARDVQAPRFARRRLRVLERVQLLLAVVVVHVVGVVVVALPGHVVVALALRVRPVRVEPQLHAPRLSPAMLDAARAGAEGMSGRSARTDRERTYGRESSDSSPSSSSHAEMRIGGQRPREPPAQRECRLERGRCAREGGERDEQA